MNFNDNNLEKMLNANFEAKQIKEYIVNKWPMLFEELEALDIAKFLLHENGFSKNEILNGQADKIIEVYVSSKKHEMNSVVNYNEQSNKVKLKTKKKKIDQKKVAIALTALFAISGLAGFVHSKAQQNISNYQFDSNLKDSVGMIVSEIGSEDFENKVGIIEQNTQLGYNHEVIYNNHGTAKDIITLSNTIISMCERDLNQPEIVEFGIAHAYSNMVYKYPEHMDEIIKFLKAETEDKVEYQIIYNEVKDFDTFYEYILSKGLIDVNSKEYEQILKDIEKYKAIKKTDGLNSLRFLEEDIQNRLFALEDKYESRYEYLKDRHGELVIATADEIEETIGGRR